MLSLIFDMDGVIFDTEMLCRKAWHSMEEEYGISAEKMDQLLILCVGTNRAHMVKTSGTAGKRLSCGALSG